jgi:hypothetical protein
MIRKLVIGIIIILFLTSCRAYTLQDAQTNGDIIVGSDALLNTEKIMTFMTAVETNEVSTLRITGYTEEGDPIISDLQYEDKRIQYTYDNSRDKHGGKRKGKSKTMCDKIEMRDEIRSDHSKGKQYILAGCDQIIGIHDSDNEEIYLLFIEQK